MSALPDLADLIQHTDCAYLDEHFAWRADPTTIADQLHAAIRAEVLDEQNPEDQETLEEAAQMYRHLRDAIVETMADPSAWDGDGDEGSILANYVRWLAAGQPTEDSDFFQPGHTYAEPGDTTDWRFRCDSITTHPADGERTAIGWRHFRGEWEPYAYGEDDWEIHQIVDHIDITEAGDR